LKRREQKFAIQSIRIAAVFGLVATVLAALTGDESGYLIAKHQPMKLAAVEAHYEGDSAAGLSAIGLLDFSKESYNDGKDAFVFNIKIPYMLSYLATRDANGYVPGIRNLIEGGYKQSDGTVALSAEEKMARGRLAVSSLAAYRQAKKSKEQDEAVAAQALATLQENIPYFGYGYIKDASELIPNVTFSYYAFRVMVGLGFYFILFFAVVLFFVYRKQLTRLRWMHRVAVLTIPLAYIAGQAGWVVAEVGRQPWTIQDLLPVSAAVSRLSEGSVMTTFFIFVVLFTVLLIAEIGIMLKEIRKGPEGSK
jgi:cytochrome d ubiquinol oxidase subunit I